MAVTELTQPDLYVLGLLAALPTALVLFKRIADTWTRVLLAFGGAILWGFFGIASFDIVIITTCCRVHTTKLPFVFIGLGLAASLTLYALYDLVVGIGEEAAETGAGDVFNP